MVILSKVSHMAIDKAYDARTLKSLDQEAMRYNLELATVAGQTIKLSNEVQYVMETAQDVKPFPIPLKIADQVYVDARTFAGLDRDGVLKIRNPVEHQLRLDQARWEIVWAKHDAQQAVLMAQFPSHHEIFGKWIGDLLSNTYALAPYQSAQVQMLAAAYSVGQFAGRVTDPLQIRRFQERIAQELRLDISIMETVTGYGDENIAFPVSLDEFIEMLHAADISARLVDVRVETISQAASKSFFGVSNEDWLCRLALEYPPALLVMIAASLRNNMFNRTRIGGLVRNSKVMKDKQRFLMNYERLLNQYAGPITYNKE